MGYRKWERKAGMTIGRLFRRLPTNLSLCSVQFIAQATNADVNQKVIRGTEQWA